MNVSWRRLQSVADRESVPGQVRSFPGIPGIREFREWTGAPNDGWMMESSIVDGLMLLLSNYNGIYCDHSMFSLVYMNSKPGSTLSYKTPKTGYGDPHGYGYGVGMGMIFHPHIPKGILWGCLMNLK